MRIKTELLKKRPVCFLHFVTAVDEPGGMYSFCCESQPLATARSFELPKRCPFCQGQNPVGKDSKVTTRPDARMMHPRLDSNEGL